MRLHYRAAEDQFGLIIAGSDLVIQVGDLPIHILVLHIDLLRNAAEGSLHRATSKDACWSTDGCSAKHSSKIPLLLRYLFRFMYLVSCLLWNILSVWLTLRFLIIDFLLELGFRNLCGLRHLNSLLLLIHLTEKLIFSHDGWRSLQQDGCLSELTRLWNLVIHVVIKDWINDRIVLLIFVYRRQVYFLFYHILIVLLTGLRGLFTMGWSFIWCKETIMAKSVTLDARALLRSHLVLV